MKLPNTLLGSLALGAAALLLAPADSAEGFGLLGHTLGVAQRDFRVFNNFSDNQTNNNTAEEPNFPGYTGAVLAIWKGCVEWGSGPHGDGTSADTSQLNIGDGGANFDPSFQGENTEVGSGQDNTHSAISGSSGGVFAFMTGGGSGWRIRYYEGWTWADGPAGIGPGAVDLQGVGCHEYGHALGMAHSSVGSATMYFATSPGTTGSRSINFDDSAGIQAAYGVKSATKPEITGVALDPAGTEVTITGSNFSPTDNQVWFTQSLKGGSGTPVQVFGVASTAGGTEITVQLPVGSGKGDVLVKNADSGHASVSNAWPFDGEGPAPQGPKITAVSPPEIPSLFPTNEQEVVLTGTELDTVTAVSVDGAPLPLGVPGYSILGADELRFSMPPQDQLGTVTIELQSPLGAETVDVEVVAPPTPVLRLGAGTGNESFFSNIPVEFRLGGQPGNALLLFWSYSDLPSCLPSVVCMDIGSSFAELEFLEPFTVEPKGWNEFLVQTTGSTLGTQFHFQTVEWDPLTQTVPPAVSNPASGTWIF